MVEVVVRVVVDQVAGDEAGEEREGGGRPEDQDVGPEEEGRQRDAHGRRHHEPHRVVGMVVMDAVDDAVEPVAAAELRLPVEDEPMQPVLGHGPDPEAREDQQGGLEPAEAAIDPDPDSADHDGNEDDRRNRGMDAGEEVEEPALEHRRRGRELRCPLLRHGEKV
jgi:hypothetical protein